MTPQQKGDVAQLKAQLRAAERGVTTSKPTSEGCRYDLVLDEDGTLLRAQVKWGGCPSSHAEGAVQVDLRKDSAVGAKSRKYNSSEVDVLLVYVPQLDKVLRFDAAYFHNKPALNIRFAPPKNGRKTGMTMAADFIW